MEPTSPVAEPAEEGVQRQREAYGIRERYAIDPLVQAGSDALVQVTGFYTKALQDAAQHITDLQSEIRRLQGVELKLRYELRKSETVSRVCADEMNERLNRALEELENKNARIVSLETQLTRSRESMLKKPDHGA